MHCGFLQERKDIISEKRKKNDTKVQRVKGGKISKKVCS